MLNGAKEMLSGAKEMLNDYKWDEENDNIVIKVDPDQLFDRIKEIFDKYIQDLLAKMQRFWRIIHRS